MPWAKLQHAIDALDHKVSRLSALVTEGFLAMSKTIEDLASALDAATNAIATALAAESETIHTLSLEVASLRASLTPTKPVSAEVLDHLTAISDRLTAAATTIAAQTITLAQIGADPANPVPAPAEPAPADPTPVA